MGTVGKTLLILSGGVEAIKGIEIAKAMGLKVVVVDGNPDAPGRVLADAFIEANIYDPSAVVRMIAAYEGREKVDGVITVASDAVRSVAAVAEFLGLPGISKETAFLSTEKFEMKLRFEESSIPVPGFVSIGSIDELIANVGRWPKAVLKPVDSRGARGVVRIGAEDDLQWAYAYSCGFSPSKRLILEEWIEGPQLSTESLVVDGKTYLCGVADRNYSRLPEAYPYVIEDGGETPSRFSPMIDEQLTKLLDSAANALGIESGVLKGDIVLNEAEGNAPYIIEVATRLSGGFFSTITIPLVYEINIVERAILLSLGQLPPLPERLTPICFQANRFLFLPPGTVANVCGPETDQLPEYVKYFELNAAVGDVVPNIENHTMRRGSVLVNAETRGEAVTRAESIITSIEVEVEDRAPLVQ
ncbi:MAG: ATP-grasp domain-containing protein [Proteobacteria bacterium]|nr:ATP-grasp domain-containing protein [Pseudomonadota bacterium]